MACRLCKQDVPTGHQVRRQVTLDFPEGKREVSVLAGLFLLAPREEVREKLVLQRYRDNEERDRAGLKPLPAVSDVEILAEQINRGEAIDLCETCRKRVGDQTDLV